VRVLADTHTLVWALSDPRALSKKAWQALNEGEVIASVASLWELLLKRSKKSALLTDPIPWWERYVVRSQITTLPIRTGHVIALAALPGLHKDPFDRILVAQSKHENLALVSRDAQLKRYGVPVIW
jgi:PIN domain nuclease of toxin-antitoxin system